MKSKPIPAVAALILAALFAMSPASAEGLRVLLLNSGPTDVQLEDASKTIHTELEPGEMKEVQLLPRQWIQLGQEVFLYDTSRIKRAAKLGAPVIQVGPGSKLFLLPSGSQEPVIRPPKQPRGFPLRPLRKVDLT